MEHEVLEGLKIAVAAVSVISLVLAGLMMIL
ncbi:MAG: hypothetical protein HLUCCX14_13250 [Marinobacter excellens HL-55]|uniref:Uncharacterized protein n=1 Tax=Marinobacter excellens HL-55 TaxID=1305731 RepID=A0A0N8KKD7_9GAMM|nr:MAG: hypothetical protein HLUCCX14_13250 [Marinobacter excellens HL-55]